MLFCDLMTCRTAQIWQKSLFLLRYKKTDKKKKVFAVIGRERTMRTTNYYTQHLGTAKRCARLKPWAHYKLWFADDAIHCSHFLMPFPCCSTRICVSESLSNQQAACFMDLFGSAQYGLNWKVYWILFFSLARLLLCVCVTSIFVNLFLTRTLPI